MQRKDNAICIRKVDYSDSSLILTLFSREHGKIKLIAKGVRKHKASAANIEIFAYGEIMFIPPRTGEIGTLTEFEPKRNFSELRRNLYILNYSLCCADLLYYFVNDYQPDPDLFDRYIDFLEHISLASRLEATQSLIIFQLDMLELTGNNINISSCCKCGQVFDMSWKEAWFSPKLTGILCPSCYLVASDRFSLSAGAINTIIHRERIRDIEELNSLWYLEKFILKYICCMLGKQPRMVDTIKQLFENIATGNE